jgi:GT2 family glycosyltransferase/MoaA/NifB/PqqE/SkfB family radical SAM enzyme
MLDPGIRIQRKLGVAAVELAPEIPAPLPRILWIELTSKCPFDCIFCSRRLRRGDGEHMDFGLYRSLIRQLDRPEVVRLNYSGESVHYPWLVEAIELAKSAGATVELVSALASISPALLEGVAASGLDRLTVSLHTMDPAEYRRIYRFGSLDLLRARIDELLRLGAQRPRLDFTFVALHSNLDQLGAVAEYARQAGVREISVQPLIRRDPIPHDFSTELDSQNRLREPFKLRLLKAVQTASAAHPDVRITLSNPGPGGLPEGARIRTCEQNPWETLHVLANGDLTACEVHDRVALGNLHASSLEEIWHGESYRAFRAQYAAGRIAECRECPWKTTYFPPGWQLGRGWHLPRDGDLLWSKRESSLVLKTAAPSGGIRIRGVLPHSLDGQPNVLEIECNGRHLGRVVNSSGRLLDFDSFFAIPHPQGEVLNLRLRTRTLLRPSQAGLNEDHRDLGFALASAEVAPRPRSRSAALRLLLLVPFYCSLTVLDRICQWLHGNAAGQGAENQKAKGKNQKAKMANSAPWGLSPARLGPARHARPTRQSSIVNDSIPNESIVNSDLGGTAPGVSVLIPERDNVALLGDCLDSLSRAAAHVAEPLEVIVVVNGSEPALYTGLREKHPQVKWLFSKRPLGFSTAIRRGLEVAAHEWVYLLNNDMTVDPTAISEALRCRAPDVFAVASQIHFKDPARPREETNWTDFRISDGLIEIQDVVPEDLERTCDSFYAGGGSSLFQKRVLMAVMGRGDPYHPFYWEDVEWSTVAKKKGYRVLFCPRSNVRHTHRATVSKFYPTSEVDRIFRRNGYLYQLRDLTESGSLRRVFSRAASSDWRTVFELLRPATVLGIHLARARSWFYPGGDTGLMVRRGEWGS